MPKPMPKSMPERGGKATDAQRAGMKRLYAATSNRQLEDARLVDPHGPAVGEYPGRGRVYPPSSSRSLVRCWGHGVAGCVGWHVATEPSCWHCGERRAIK